MVTSIDFEKRYTELKREHSPKWDEAGFVAGLKNLLDAARAGGAEAWVLFFEARVAEQKNDPQI